jgi:beta-glucanase (GH16 family)/glycerophosphoryl diester phosphodiesterase
MKDIVVAHRGAWKEGKLPENSLASLKKALNLKCAGTEFDVRMTADSILVVNHDPKYFGLDIETVMYKDLTHKNLKNGEKIPLLSTYLTEGIKNNQLTRLVLEIKPSEISKERGKLIAREVLQLVKKLDVESKVDYISFDIDILKELILLNPKVSTQYLNGELSPKELKELGISGLDYHYKVYYDKPEWIQQAKDLHMILNVWTVNKKKDMDFFIRNDFHYITTNEPELLYKKLATVNANKWKMIWNDEFEKNGLPDEKKWSYDVGGHGWGNNEKQYYLSHSKENAYIKDGLLHIVALKKKHEQLDYTSAKITTYQKLDMQYGKIEVRAKLPQGKGSWPAIWMLPVTIRTKEEPWPLCGEIDIMEHVGKDPNVVHTSLHSELYNHVKGTQITHFEKMNDVFDQFHTYGIEWDEKSIRFIYDGKLYFETFKGQDGRITNNEGWPFDKPYFLILNLAIGGNWGGEIDESIFPNEMIVDYVRVYKQK